MVLTCPTCNITIPNTIFLTFMQFCFPKEHPVFSEYMYVITLISMTFLWYVAFLDKYP